MLKKQKPNLAEAVAKINHSINPSSVQDKQLKSVRTTKQLLLRLPSAAHKQLKFLSIDQERDMQSLMIESLNDLFVKYGKDSIA